MTQRHRLTLTRHGAVTALALLIPAGVARADCPAADTAWRLGRRAATAHQARRCLTDSPDDPGALFALSRAQSARGAYTRSLRTLERALERYPEDVDLRLWKARVLYWSGLYEEAWKVVHTLPYSTPAEEETARLRAAVAFARGDWERAQYGFTLVEGTGNAEPVIRRNRGLSSLEMGEDDQALEDFHALASTGDADGLALARSLARWRIELQPGWAASDDGEGGWQARGGAAHRIDGQDLWLGVSAERRVRSFDGVPASDTWLQTHGSWQREGGLLLDGAIGATPRPDFTPTAAAWLEPGWSFGRMGLELRVRAWQMWFSDSTASVISPAAVLYLGPVDLYARSYHSWDGDEQPGLSGLLRVGLAPAPRLHISVLGGLGNRADYLTPLAGSLEQSWVAGGGVRLDLNVRHSVRLDGRVRRESTTGEELTTVDVRLGSSWTF